MRLAGNGLWSVECEAVKGATYHYQVCNAEGQPLRRERRAHICESMTNSCTIYDAWWDMPQEQPFYSSFFTRGPLRRTKRNRKPLQCPTKGILVEVEAPRLAKDEYLALVGANHALGNWDVSKARRMNDALSPTWRATLPEEALGSEYKFAIINSKGELITFESGENRLLPYSSGGAIVLRGLRLRNPQKKWRGAGVAIPVFSLRSEKSWGVGEFSDLKTMALWAKLTDMSIIQVLPVNDTSASLSWRDSYPYNAISSFALHPLYLGAEAAIECCCQQVNEELGVEIKALLEKYKPLAQKLNALKEVDYQKSIKLKMRFAKELYGLCGKQVIASKAYNEFLSQSEQWLTPYAVYCVLRDRYKTTDFHTWADLSTYQPDRAKEFISRNRSKVDFYRFLQYLLDSELIAASNYAHSQGIALKGDIPIGVSPTSVDVWQEPSLYNTSMSAGAPPDAFAEEGQNWGFPTYNWERMAEDGYDWWRRRLRKMARYFDAYRIDHILGFFRIWEVPREAQSAILGHFYPSLSYSAEDIIKAGFNLDTKKHIAKEYNTSNTLFVNYPEGGFTPRIEGFKTEQFAALSSSEQEAYMRLHEEFFYNRHNDFWQECAQRRLPALTEATDMLTCGEDLGMIPSCVPQTMLNERILSLEIERMPKAMGATFGEPKQYPYLSVTATSTHDMSPIRGWWREDYSLTNRYWRECLHLDGQAEKECSGKSARMIIERQMCSNSILAILPLQDWLAIDETLRTENPDSERINIPANPNHYWRYRMHLQLEELLAAKSFNLAIKGLVALRNQ